MHLHLWCGGRHGHDRMVVGFTTTYVISVYHHWCCEFESRSGRGVQHYVIKFVSDLRQVLRFPPPINWLPRYNWNIVESGVKHHKTNKQATSNNQLLILIKLIFLAFQLIIIKLIWYSWSIFKIVHISIISKAVILINCLKKRIPLTCKETASSLELVLLEHTEKWK